MSLFFTFVRLPLDFVSKLPVFIMPLFIRNYVIDFIYDLYINAWFILRFLVKSWGGGVMNLVYGSLFSSLMASFVFCSDE